MPKLVGIREWMSMRYAEEMVLVAGQSTEVHWSWCEKGPGTTFLVTNIEGALPDLDRLDEGYQTLLYTALSLVLGEDEHFRIGAHQITPRDPPVHAELLELRSAVQVLEMQLRMLGAAKTATQHAIASSASELTVHPYRDPPSPIAAAFAELKREAATLDHRVLRQPILVPPRHRGLQARGSVLATPALEGICPVRWILSVGGVESRDVL